MKVVLAQLNPVVGDIAGNLAGLEQTLEQARTMSPDLVVFPELFLTGYPPRDLLARDWFIRQCESALSEVSRLSAKFADFGIIVGAPVSSGQSMGKGLFNAALLFSGGRQLLCQGKSLLPTYDVFDETRYFDPALEVRVVKFRGETLGVSVCEDAWNSAEMWERTLYERDPIAELADAGATLLVNISASPFVAGKPETRYALLQNHARRHRVPLVFVNQVGGNDELVFDGASMVFDRTGCHVRLLPGFQEAVELIDASEQGSLDRPPAGGIASVHDALVLGIRDYVHKCGFEKVVLGLSGGVDSAVTCCLAVAALGPEKVLGITMPSEYSSPGSAGDSRALAANLGIELRAVPIQDVHNSYLKALAEQFAGRSPDVTEENIQARVRGSILMAVSNKLGYLVLSTGNKSELAVGYCTLYGDMCGGLCVLADVPKSMVYELAKHINREASVIPEATIAKPPSAELRPNQTDQDTLPPYEVLDRILARYVDEGRSAKEIVAEGFETKTVDWVISAVNRSEYKRRQAAPGLKVTGRAFGTGWRMPIAARY
jgi:NAD+ synthase (glutamine-hydrolysing)